MRKFKVVFRPAARADLFALHDYIAAEAGLVVAGDYIERIETVCRSLSTLPRRGARRDDIRSGLRIIGFERRAVIAYDVQGDEVRIARVLHGRRDIQRLLVGDED